MSRSVQKVGVAESNVGRTGPNLPPDIFQDGLCREDEEPALVYRDDGAVEAVVQAPAAGLDISDQVQRAVVFEAGVAIERGQTRAAGGRGNRPGALEDPIRPPAARGDPPPGARKPAPLRVKPPPRNSHPGGRVPRRLEERDRLGEADRLVAELVTRDQQNRARLPQRLPLVRRRSRDLVDAQLHRVHRSFSFSLPSRTAFFATIPRRPLEWEPLAADLAQRLFRHHEGATRIGVQGIGRRELLARWGGLAFGGGDNPPVLVLAADVA